MARKELLWRGKTSEELKLIDISEFAQLVASRERRKLKRGFTVQEKLFVEELSSGKNNLETHCRDIIIMPSMLGKTIKVYNGKEFTPVIIELEMLGHRLGEFALTRKHVQHSAPGIGATRSSAAISVK